MNISDACSQVWQPEVGHWKVARLEVARILLDTVLSLDPAASDAQLAASDGHGDNRLHLAASSWTPYRPEHAALAERLVPALLAAAPAALAQRVGADYKILWQSADGSTPAHLAAITGSMFLERLIDKGADLQ